MSADPIARMAAALLIGLTLSGGCNPSAQEGLDRETRIRFQQYMAAGRLLYLQHCSNCHQEDGSGLRRLIPPLENSDHLDDPAQVACWIRNGLQGPIRVRGQEYDFRMPPNQALTNLEIAEIVTYVSNSWGNDLGWINLQPGSVCR